MTPSQELIKMHEKYGAHNYHPLPLVLKRGQGSKVWDVEGREYLDFLSCYSALNFGHQHPKLVEALLAQLSELALCSRAFFTEELSCFAKELAEFCGLDSVLPMNSGAEAVESALKIARKWGYEKKGVASDRASILVMKNNFHGRTISVISFSTEAAYKKNFGPFTPGFTVAEFGDMADVERVWDKNIVGVLVEPIQAEAGILVPPAGYLASLRKFCTEQNALLIADEIQTGMGRTGRDFCFEHENARPDILILGKSLGGGLLPVSAAVATRDVMEVIRPGQHGSTFGGNPLACAVGRAVLKVMKEDRVSEKAARVGESIKARLTTVPLPKVKEVRGMGALVGIELEERAGGARKYCERLAEVGLLCKETHDHVIRLAPPLLISDHDLNSGLDKLVAVVEELG